MLSKMKTSAPETRSSVSQASQASDVEDNETIDNDTNNNNNSNINNNQQTKKSQDELLDIVEVSRKRRLSKDSADSLTSFIRWSFTHVESPTRQRLAEQYSSVKTGELDVEDLVDGNLEVDVDDVDGLTGDDEDIEHWENNSQPSDFSTTGNRFKMHEQLLRQVKLNTGSTSAANLASIKSQSERHLSLGNLLSEGLRGSKRRHYSPERESKFIHHQPNGRVNGTASRKSSPSYLGNVVERLHHQQQQKQQLSQDPLQQQQQQHQEPADDAQANVSFHLQQFLQQQTSLEDLCSSIGLEDGNQLVLAAAIHRALVDSAGSTNPLSQVDSKSTASSTGSSSGGSSGSNPTNSNTLNQLNNPLSAGAAAAAANLHLVESMNRQRRAYNTRAALHGHLGTGLNHRQNALNQINNRIQQQRHAQAAAALSALASAGTHHHSALHHLPASHAPNTPLVDFKCDTCPSSFDDRHRLMQHQSIHLELKKDWFTETPVDEVMKIFNRRRGEFLCNICNLRFEATLDYDQHNHTVHGPRPYCCQFCGNGTRTFKCWRQYLNHLYDHRYIFSCTIDNCDFTVNRRDSLRFHIFRFHLNCQLPQNQQKQSRGPMMLANHGNSKWPSMEEDEDTENEMNVAD